MQRASGDNVYYSRNLPEPATANQLNQYKNHATLYPATLNILYRLEQHTHLVLCHSTPFTEV